MVVRPGMPMVLNGLGDCSGVRTICRGYAPCGVGTCLGLSGGCGGVVAAPRDFRGVHGTTGRLNVGVCRRFFYLCSRYRGAARSVSCHEDVAGPVRSFFTFGSGTVISTAPLSVSRAGFRRRNFAGVGVMPGCSCHGPLALVMAGDCCGEVGRALSKLGSDGGVYVFFGIASNVTSLVSGLSVASCGIFYSRGDTGGLVGEKVGGTCSRVACPLTEIGFFAYEFCSTLSVAGCSKIGPSVVVLASLHATG